MHFLQNESPLTREFIRISDLEFVAEGTQPKADVEVGIFLILDT